MMPILAILAEIWAFGNLMCGGSRSVQGGHPGGQTCRGTADEAMTVMRGMISNEGVMKEVRSDFRFTESDQTLPQRPVAMPSWGRINRLGRLHKSRFGVRRFVGARAVGPEFGRMKRTVD